MKPKISLPHSQVPATCPYLVRAPPSHFLKIQLHPFHSPTFHFLKIHFNIILPSTSGFPMKTLSLRVPHQYTVYASSLAHTRYMTHPSHSPRFDHPNNICRGLQIIKLLITQFSPLSCYLVPLRPKYSPQHPIPKHPQPTFFLQCERPSCSALLHYT